MFAPAHRRFIYIFPAYIIHLTTRNSNVFFHEKHVFFRNNGFFRKKSSWSKHFRDDFSQNTGCSHRTGNRAASGTPQKKQSPEKRKTKNANESGKADDKTYRPHKTYNLILFSVIIFSEQQNVNSNQKDRENKSRNIYRNYAQIRDLITDRLSGIKENIFRYNKLCNIVQ